MRDWEKEAKGEGREGVEVSSKEWDDRVVMNTDPRESVERESTYDGREDEGRSRHGGQISRDVGETATFRAERREGEGGKPNEGRREGTSERREVNFLSSFNPPSLSNEPLDERSPGSLCISQGRKRESVSSDGASERRRREGRGFAR